MTSDGQVTYLLLDTSYLRKVGFRDPDFQKLMHFSKQKVLKVYVPHIAWEERRTQLLDGIYQKARKLKVTLDSLKNPHLGGIAINGLAPLGLDVWTESDIDKSSKDAMNDFATENLIEVIPIAPDHAGRMWNRYFKSEPPFDPAKERIDRRKDIPDCWIFEAAIDLTKEHRDLFALCCDENLSKALSSIGVTVFAETQRIIDIVDRALVAEPLTEPRDVPSTAAPATAGNELNALLATSDDRFRELETRVLGYVGYLGSPTKDQLFSLLAQRGTPVEVGRNAAERLANEGFIQDTGNHYLPANKEACSLAAPLVESEIIKFLGTT